MFMKQESTTTRHSLWALALSLFLIAQTACMNNPSQFWANGEENTFFQANGVKIEKLGSGRQEKVIGKFFLDNYLVGKIKLTVKSQKKIIKWFEKNLSLEEKNEITKRILGREDKTITFRLLKKKLEGNTKTFNKIEEECRNDIEAQKKKEIKKAESKKNKLLLISDSGLEDLKSPIKDLCKGLSKTDQDFIDYTRCNENIIRQYIEFGLNDKINMVLWVVKNEELQVKIIRGLLEMFVGNRERVLEDVLSIENKYLPSEQKIAIIKVIFEKSEITKRSTRILRKCPDEKIQKFISEKRS